MNIFNYEHDIKSILFHQVKPNVSLSPTVENALCRINRIAFLPPSSRDVAYSDTPIHLKRRCEMPFHILAQLLQHLKIAPHESACVVSAGAGYSATLLAELCSKVEAFESISVIFARLLDTTRGNTCITPISVLSSQPVDIIIMDGSAYDKISQSISDKLNPGGRLSYIRPISANQSSLGDPLCDVIILEKNHDGSFKKANVITQIHFPNFNNENAANQPFLF